MIKVKRNTIRGLLMALAVQSHVWADVVPATMFGDHMVLQRGMPVTVWGRAAPGEAVTVRFAGETGSATADPDGTWRVQLPVLPPSSEGREMTIEGSNRVVLKDVLVGEVWICSGQSNMQYGWGKESHAMFNWGGDTNLAALVADATNKPIRSFAVLPDVSFAPNQNCKGSWSTSIPGSAVAFGFSYRLHQKLRVPVATIVTCWGSSSIEGWMPRDVTAVLPHFRTMMDAFDASSNVQARVRAAMERGIRHGNTFVRQQPNLLYNAMLHPVIPYASRGMVWYQGEANAVQPENYAASLPVWMSRLRAEWGRDDFHFLIVMLPGFGDKAWPRFREVQLGVLKTPHTSVVNTIDLGDEKNIHPADKAPITDRLALLARRDVYGESIEAQGPVYTGFTVQGSRVTITFDHANGLRTSDGGAPQGFRLAGEDKVWRPAVASIRGTAVVLESDGLAVPVAVRYAYAGKPAVNLVNAAGLPAYPFRTDDWTP